MMGKIITLLLSILLAGNIAFGALLFGTDGDRVAHASNAVYDFGNTGFACAWIYPTSDTARQIIFNRSNVGGAYFEMNWRADLAGDNFEFDRERDTGLNDIFVQANAANFTHYGLNKWIFVCAVFDTAGGNSAQRILIGDLDSPLAEPSAYATQTAGSGTASTSWGTNDFHFGGLPSPATRKFFGRIAITLSGTFAATTAQLTELQWHPRSVPNLVLCSHYGFPGTTVVDCSGNAITGTATGPTNADHVPVGFLFGQNKYRPDAWNTYAE